MISEDSDARASDLALAEAVLAMHGRMRRAQLAAKADAVTASQSAVLGRLVRDGAQSTADLARAEGVRPQSMGATVQALVDLALVVREAHPDDGRKTIVRATSAGTAARAGALESRARLIADRLGRLDASERAVVERAIPVIGALVEP